jgi:hypothetical protein
MAGKNVASFFHQNKNISPSAMVERGFVANPRSADLATSYFSRKRVLMNYFRRGAREHTFPDAVPRGTP